MDFEKIFFDANFATSIKSVPFVMHKVCMIRNNNMLRFQFLLNSNIDELDEIAIYLLFYRLSRYLVANLGLDNHHRNMLFKPLGSVPPILSHKIDSHVLESDWIDLTEHQSLAKIADSHYQIKILKNYPK